MPRRKKTGPMADPESSGVTTAQSLGSLIKSSRDMLRKDKGLNGDLDRLPLLTWVMFLKFLDDLERQREDEARLSGQRFRPAIEKPYRWRDWAEDPKGITGDELLKFINQDETTRPDGSKGAGLFAYLRGLTSGNGDGRRDVIATVFKGVDNRMKSGYLLRDVINKIAGIHFTSSDELHTLGALYESMLREMRDAAGDSGEFYTPRPVVRLMVDLIDPQLGETVLDPAAGTGGFLVEAFLHLAAQVKTVQQRKVVQEASIAGCEAKPLPYLLCQMNLLLHGLDSPRIDGGNALRFKLTEIGERERVDVILTNPPFGGEEEKGIQGNFPGDRQTAETALLFLQLIMRKLHRQPTGVGRAARAAVVVPNGVLSAPGVAQRIREDLLRDFTVKAIVRLPHNVFAPYTDIKTNILFLERGGPTREVYFCEPELPDNTTLSQTNPVRYEWLAPLRPLIENRIVGESAWVVQADELGPDRNLDVKNPSLKLREHDGICSADEMSAWLEELAKAYTVARGHLSAMLQEARWRSVGELTDESDARIGGAYHPGLRLQGVSAEGGIVSPKVKIGSKPEKYKILKTGYLAYNPMRINIGSIGVVRDGQQEGITSPDYVVFKCRPDLLPEYIYHFLRSEAGRHAIAQKTRGSVRFRLYYSRLAEIVVPVAATLDQQREVVKLLNELERLQRELRNAPNYAGNCLVQAYRSAFAVAG